MVIADTKHGPFQPELNGTLNRSARPHTLFALFRDSNQWNMKKSCNVMKNAVPGNVQKFPDVKKM